MEEQTVFTVFDFKFANYGHEELEENFHKFFKRNGLNPLFTLEHKSTPITVSWTEALAVTNEGDENGKGEGRFANTFKDFAEHYLMEGANNQMYNEAILKIIYNAGSLTKLHNDIKKYMAYIDTIEENKKHNTWNIVWYTKPVG